MALNTQSRRRALLWVLLLAMGQLGHAATPLSYAPAIVVLKGQVEIEDRYGPPNFGDDPKTDERVKVPVLVLDAPVDVLTDPKQDVSLDSFRNVRRMQLFGDWGALLKLSGRRITVRGTLREKSGSANYTDVLIDVQKIEQVE